MGDGIQKKYALIVNGDTEARHLGNVDRAVKALRTEGSYDISVASPKAPGGAVEHFEAPSREGLEKLLSGMKAQMDDDDLLVVYFTGHGDSGAKGEGCVALPTECLSLSSLSADLKKLSYGKRILVMDNCYSGSGFNLFTDTKTTVVSQGSPGEKVSCQLFSPFFWSDQVPDADQDGKISVQERFQHAVLKGQSESLLQFYSPEPLSFSGGVAARPFRTADSKPVEVKNGKELKAQLARLKPGQVALVAFSADWCVPCKSYQPHFEKIAHQDGGRVLMIHAEGRDGSEEDWAEFGVTSFPTVSFVDWNGKVGKVADRMDPMASLALLAVHSPEEQIKVYLAKLNSGDAKERFRATLGLRAMEAKAGPAAAALGKALRDPDATVRLGAVWALAEIGPAAEPAIPALLKCLEADDYELVLGAARALGAIGPKAKSAVPALLKRFGSNLQRLAQIAVAESGLNPTLNLHLADDKAFALAGALVGSAVRIDPGNSDLLKTFLEILRDAKSDYLRRRHAVAGLAKMGGAAAEAAPQLMAMIEDPQIGHNCLTALAAIGKSSPNTLALLMAQAADRKQAPFLRFHYLQTLGDVGAPAASHGETLLKMAQDPTEDPRLRKQALLTLRKVDPSKTQATEALLASFADVSLLFSKPRTAEEEPPPAPQALPRWSFSPSAEFSARPGAGGAGFGLTAGYRVSRTFELRLGATFQGMHLAKEDRPADFQAGLRFEPILHLFGAPEKSGAHLTLGEIGAYHLFANGITGGYFAPLGIGFSIKVGENSQLSLGLKGQVHREKDWNWGGSGQFGWVTRF
ncbi:MAG: HEAT repeat domain-containing protein [Deltaproteobacteria bacterium]|nr:HEAT repeat domain-containing protein [Deltaproteobacteria bacterium]